MPSGKSVILYCGHGIVDSVRVADNTEGVQHALELADGLDHGLVFVILNYFDSKYGHRRDVLGRHALERLDGMIPAILKCIRPGDGLLFTADHGLRSHRTGSDHTREYVPFVEYGTAAGSDIGVVEGMSLVGERMAAISPPVRTRAPLETRFGSTGGPAARPIDTGRQVPGWLGRARVPPTSWSRVSGGPSAG